MTKYERQMIFEYFLFNTSRISDEMTAIHNNLMFRNFDEVDCLDYVILMTKKRDYDRIERELTRLLKL